MIPVVRHGGIVAALQRGTIGTEVISPKQYLKSVKPSGFGTNLFDSWRYLAPGDLESDHSRRPRNPDFVLNQSRYQGSSILVTGANFGCGSSREHAVWAFLDAGFRAVIAPSFADIFDTNAAKNGLLTVRLPEDAVRTLVEEIEQTEGYQLDIDLPEQTVAADSGVTWSFDIDPQRKRCLVEGLDDIALTLHHADRIREFEATRRVHAPWLFDRFGSP